jgi:hypothetical protein
MLLRFGVLVVAGIAILSGLAGMLIGGLVVATGATLDLVAQSSKDSIEVAGGFALIAVGLVVVIFGVLQVIFGVGMWRLSAWAWIAGVIIQSFTLVTAVLGLFTGAAIPASLVTILISGAILAFLLTPRVRKAFGRSRSRALSAPATQGPVVDHQTAVHDHTQPTALRDLRPFHADDPNL